VTKAGDIVEWNQFDWDTVVPGTLVVGPSRGVIVLSLKPWNLLYGLQTMIVTWLTDRGVVEQSTQYRKRFDF
jgi:hypothetical protein